MNENLKQDSTKLFNSKTFCILPWIHLHVMPDSTAIPCCVSPYDDIYGDGKNQNLIEIWNSEKYKKLRLNMLADISSKGCTRCYQIENAGFESMRKRFNNTFKDYISAVEQTKEDGGLEKVDLKYIDIRFSNLCNFKCRGCGPSLSSAWRDDHLALFQYKLDTPKVNSISANSPKLWDELKEQIPNAEEVYFGGGEPLITKEHYEVLNLLMSMNRYDIRLCYNTNLSQLNYGAADLAEIWSKFNFVSLGISIDDIGKRAEYFRHGTKWDVIERNMKKLRDNYPNIFLYVNCTVSLMNIYYLPELYSYLIDNKIILPDRMHINLLLDPIELSAQVLPKEYKTEVRNKINKYILQLYKMGPEYLKAAFDFKNVVKFMDEKDTSDLLPLFKENTLKLDALRNEKFAEVYPELSKLVE